MTIYDIIQIVSPGARTSVPPGRWSAGFSAVESEAELTASAYQRHTTVLGVTYVVERHDELCPGRAKQVHERHEVGECSCKGE